MGRCSKIFRNLSNTTVSLPTTKVSKKEKLFSGRSEIFLIALLHLSPFLIENHATSVSSHKRQVKTKPIKKVIACIMLRDIW